MVDNKDQFDELEYEDNEAYDEEEYSDDVDNQDGDESYEEYDEDEYDYDEEDEDEDEDEDGQKKKSNPLFLIILLIVLIAVIIFFFMSKGGNNSSTLGNSKTSSNIETNNMFEDNNQSRDQEQSEGELSDSFFSETGDAGNENEMMSVNFNETGEANVAAGEGENASVATVSESSTSNVAKESDLFDSQEQPVNSSQENNAIMVVYNKSARSNPFKPPVLPKESEEIVPFDIINTIPFEIIEPPKESVVDENLTRLLKTQISGILYDNESPSAIVNLNGIDHFVKVGDTISGYTIKSITRDKVQISYKNNSYVASVGELFTQGNLEKQQAVANLQNKFAGRYKN